ncbi:MAG: tetratricopeptide repeat protein, partial [Treponemataceae bacterium]|nr:tetratricopeptide repeat protein [Treponemataceae bacterium]
EPARLKLLAFTSEHLDYEAGEVLCRQGDYAAARPYLERAVTLSPRHPVLLFHQGYCLVKLGEKNAAREALRQALAAPGEFPQRPEAEKLLRELEQGS